MLMNIARRLINLKIPKRYKHHDALENTTRDEKITVDILNRKFDETIMIDAFSPIGFKINNGLNIYGPLIMLPRTVLSWNISGIEEVNVNSLTLFYLLEPKIDILIIGVGEKSNLGKIDLSILEFMKSKNINVEILPTENACPLYNLLAHERPLIAGAFIPPADLKFTSGMNISRVEPGYAMDVDFRRLNEKELETAIKDEKVFKRILDEQSALGNKIAMYIKNTRGGAFDPLSPAVPESPLEKTPNANAAKNKELSPSQPSSKLYGNTDTDTEKK